MMQISLSRFFFRNMLRLTLVACAGPVLLHAVDWSMIPAKAPQVKTCCGREVCRCTHAKGAACPFREAKGKARSLKTHAGDDRVVAAHGSEEPRGNHGHGFCHLKKKPKDSSPHAVEKPAPWARQNEAVLLKMAPCSHRNPGDAVPGHSREFTFPVTGPGRRVPDAGAVLFRRFQQQDDLFVRELLKPPRLLHSAF